ncbi:Zinc (Zn2)-Iron (Fe2) Permease (ZIP) Family [Phytophthora nicotianae]|uniref:protein-serine/threonine phosphatase n=1 Tax=Phytophthora nicotianae TaxID=4792 RepID=A0A0W8DB45_PHYNI|nr:Zinc (Zn2)-Iron (Fe2) Permease (ZIP) Family [Phytophthora nicotianae]
MTSVNDAALEEVKPVSSGSGPDQWIENLRNGKVLSELELKQVCEMVKLLLIEESNVQPVSSPVTVCGDIHGQFFDLLELFRCGGDIENTNYIFMSASRRFPTKDLFCDLMWSDPEDIETWAMSPRGAGYLFGAKVTQEFNQINGLDLICRAHQLVQEGYKYMFDNSLVTVWSAPNYCYRCGNVAAILSFDENLERDFKLFREVAESSDGFNQRALVPYFL